LNAFLELAVISIALRARAVSSGVFSGHPAFLVV
jgi:hypothetical protein